jgi:hypothetical protein
MKKRLQLLAIVTVLFSQSCTPEPIYIKVAQEPAKLAISSSVLDGNLILISATYSISSLEQLDGQESTTNIGNNTSNLMIENGLAVISYNGNKDTLRQIAPSIFAWNAPSLVENKIYELYIKDIKNNREALSSSHFTRKIAVRNLQPEIKKTATDTFLNVSCDFEYEVSTPSYYLLCYQEFADSSGTSTALPSVFGLSESRKMILFTSRNLAQQNGIPRFELEIKSDKSYVLVHLAKIDKGYFDYLSAYEKSGNILSQLTSEPISLPTNIVNGYGYFTLYQPYRALIDLKKI